MGEYIKFNFVAMMFLEGNLSQRIKTKDCLWTRTQNTSSKSKISDREQSAQGSHENLMLISDKDDGKYIKERCICNIFEERQVKNMINNEGTYLRESTIDDAISQRIELLISPFDLDIYKGNKRIIHEDLADTVTKKLVASINESVNNHRKKIDVYKLERNMINFFHEHNKRGKNIDLINYYLFIRGMNQYNSNDKTYKKKLKLVTELKEIESTINDLFSKKKRGQITETLTNLRKEIIEEIRNIK